MSEKNKKHQYKLIHPALGFEYIDASVVSYIDLHENGKITFYNKAMPIASFSSDWSFIEERCIEFERN